MEGEQYHYDFSYSIAMESSQPEGREDCRKQLTQWSSILINIGCVPNQEDHNILKVLLRLPIYQKIGLELLSICEFAHNLVDNEKSELKLEKSREELYQSLQEMNRIFGKEKQKYLPLIVICYYSVINRMLFEQYSEKNSFALFHTIYWELKGQLTNQQTMEALIRANFNAVFYNKFMQLSKEDLKNLYLEKIKQTAAQGSVTFRLSARRTMGPEASMYHSFKGLGQVLDKKREKKYNKQNLGLNTHYQQKYSKPRRTMNLVEKSVDGYL